MEQHIINEIPPLSEKDCFFVTERFKTEFTFPLHRHREYELNFIQHGAGVVRVIGDSIETIGDYELVLVSGENLEHVWEQGSCKSPMIREITIQFSPELLSNNLLEKNQFDSIRKMFTLAQHGLAFSLDTIIREYSLIDSIPRETDPFIQFLKLLKLLHELSVSEGARQLATSSFAKAERNTESRRVLKVKEFINANYRDEITLSEMAAIADMSPASFSRFFKLRTGKNLSNYIIDIRLGHASRLLVDSTDTIAEICYECGFNNISNFNRIFKKKKSMTPKEFRQLYKKSKVVI
ncbi:MAG: AraC family transcriptional regulator [Bacteroidales bacterium]|jgi:AraC-like DNA-binding protein|nr:AraC family transcriptional regulator [Bacteroidales bacterium]MCI2121489.1 AraC family transcriptional regulator [Bacteroidales bacterium]MCI2145146.1 AraC family transcriptional regulator [Bacteroidales bacterium]